MNRKVTSREYKVMLKKKHFHGSKEDLITKAKLFWNALVSNKEIQNSIIKPQGSLDNLKVKRTIKFFDTRKHELRKSHYVFRERVNTNKDEREVTLKFRHQDRYFSQDRDMSEDENSKTKLEQDLKLPFLSLYSHSTTKKVNDDTTFTRVSDLRKLYPGTKKDLKALSKRKLFRIVNDFTAEEYVITGSHLLLNENPEVRAECALITWYEYLSPEDVPIAVEFSFRYKDENGKEKFNGQAAYRAYNLYQALEGMTLWVDVEGKTKTALAYS